MTTTGQMNRLLSHIGTRVVELCVHSTEYPNIDEWEGFADEFDIHFDNQDDINVLEVVAYGLKTDSDGLHQTDTEMVFYKANYNIPHTRQENQPMKEIVITELTERLLAESAKEIGVSMSDKQFNDMAKIVADFVASDRTFSARIQQYLYDGISYDIVNRVDTAVENRVNQAHREMSRTEIVNELMDRETVIQGEFFRGIMDHSRFRTMVNNNIQQQVGTWFNENNSWIADMIQNAVDIRTTLMVNETVERSLKLIASRISAGSDV